MKQQTTSPKRQYIATGIFAILAMISGLSVLQKSGNTDLTAQTMSVNQDTGDNGHSQTLEFLEANK